ncbi:DUF445 family protein [Paraburkholderia sp. BL17N1]|uniref:DUF445 family protein n=1 Tax=Paraburkholderia sp. BL17N1 TaxID=1938798 RepID=UPI000EB398B1|nr:DUF445 family protein [Paraburkholderia sp. BL17N1]
MRRHLETDSAVLRCRRLIAHQVVDWIKEEYSTLEQILPTAAIGNGAAGMIRSGVNQILKKVSDDRDHMLRKEFDSAVQVLIARLKSDRSFPEKGEELKRHLRDGEMVSTYVKDLWSGVAHVDQDRCVKSALA